ncbi:hypothetical protein FNQ90_22140 [Streptomyces alkaliphilus]|uniref:Type II toxin-antitoxin system RelE/ParE family toxin n=1 Tax=Streptomyces alkaliphilus TaxID=1472722 RepID=A0A7W3TH28_9ACTN|nr:hypothetical protein [Streptomyces alkaliphilus]MBB0246743.1 hypothetical protein [Streptomyces alkaliphilus]
MSEPSSWRWDYNPDADHVITGLPDHVVAEVERLAAELVALAEVGVDVTDIGEGPRRGVPGGMRRLPVLRDGWLYALPLPRLRLIAIIRVIPPFTDL